MMLEIICGLTIGLSVKDWTGRFILPLFVGLWACGELFFWQQKNPISGLRRHKLLNKGVGNNEIDEINRAYKASFSHSGLKGWKIYIRQFCVSSIETLIFSLLGGAIKLFFLNK